MSVQHAPKIRPTTTPVDWEQTTAMLWDYVEWIRAAAGIDLLIEQPSFAAELESPAEYYDGLDAVLFIAYHGNLAVGTVALRCHNDGTAELKRMYVRAVARGFGVADRLVASALAAAKDRGCSAVWLESMRGAMEPALAVYRRNGFVELNEPGRTIDIDGLVVMEHRLSQQCCV